MPWNQPGSGGDDRDPWGQNGGQKGNGRGGRDGPPDIDEVLRDAKNRIDSMFGGRRGGGGKGGKNGSSGDGLSSSAIIILLLVGIGAWVFSGFYTVEQGEQALELKYGAYSETKGAGLRWHMPSPFESVEIVNTTNIHSVFVGYRQAARGKRSEPVEALMLTQDENIVDIQFAVQYDIKDARDLLFNVSEYNPREIAESVVRGATEPPGMST